MEAKEKLEEARYFKDALRQTSQKPDEFNYNLSAFLSALKSVPDIMLYDFTEKFALGFTREDRLNDFVFRIVAGALNNDKALRFIEWWRQNLGELSRDPMFHKRTIIVHRGYPPLEHVYLVNASGGTGFWSSATVQGTYGTSTSGWYATSNQYSGTTHTTNQSNSVSGSNWTPTVSVSTVDAKFEIRFPDFPDKSALDVCQDIFMKIEQFVETAERDFWGDA